MLTELSKLSEVTKKPLASVKSITLREVTITFATGITTFPFRDKVQCVQERYGIYVQSTFSRELRYLSIDGTSKRVGRLWYLMRTIQQNRRPPGPSEWNTSPLVIER